MATGAQAWTEQSVEAAGVSLQMVKGGAGAPLLILHGELGHQGWLRCHDALAQDYTLHMPSHPGFGATERQEWIMNMRDLAGWYLEAIDDLGLHGANLMGFSLGGWLAAEMAAMSPDTFNRLVLVGPAGIRPPEGEIYDMFLAVAKEFLTAGFYDTASTPEFLDVCPDDVSPEQAEAWEIAREEACRLSWRPYMHYPGLPNLLHRLKRLPTQIIWGREDEIVPVSAAQVFNDSIPGSGLTIFDNCGHNPHIEKTDRFVATVREFLTS